MPVFVIEKMKLDTMALSIVDKGASGDEENRPEILIFKRKHKAAKMLEAIVKMFKGSKIDIEKMGLSQVVGAIDELGLSDEQKAGVLKLLEAFKGGAEAEPVVEPEVKAEGDPVPPNPEDDKEEEEMAKRHTEELAKRDKRIEKLEDDAQTLRLTKRAEELGFLPGYTKAETIELLKKADGDPKFDEMLTKLANASKESPLFKEAGAVDHENDNSATATLAKRVKTMQDADPELSTSAAKSKIFKADDKLYREVKAAQQD